MYGTDSVKVQWNKLDGVHIFADSFIASQSQALVNAAMNFRAP
jgi:hypothetical protein